MYFLMNHSKNVSEEIEHVIAPYIKEIEVVAQRGHKDVSTENLLLAFVELSHQQPGLFEEFIGIFLAWADQESIEFTPRAFRLSLLTSVKLYLRTLSIKDYESFSVKRWKQVLLECLSRHDQEFVFSCLRDVSTVKIYRYIALQILGGLLNPIYRDGVSILDGGCSINIGLKCLNTLSIFQHTQIDPAILHILGTHSPCSRFNTPSELINTRRAWKGL